MERLFSLYLAHLRRLRTCKQLVEKHPSLVSAEEAARIKKRRGGSQRRRKTITMDASPAIIGGAT